MIRKIIFITCLVILIDACASVFSETTMKNMD